MSIDHDRRGPAAQWAVLLTASEAVALLDIQPSTLAAWRVRGYLPLPFVRVGRYIRYRIRYRRQDLEAFIEGHLADVTDAEPA